MSKRVEQISEVIRRELNEFIIRELEPPSDILITVTDIKTTNDIKHTIIFISVLPINKVGLALKFLNNRLGRIKHHLSQRLRLHHLPELKVVADDSALKSRKVERELERLKNNS